MDTPLDNVSLIEKSVIASLPKDRLPTEEEISDLTSRLRLAFPISDESLQDLTKRIHAKFAIRMDTGTVIVEEGHIPWLAARRPKIDPFYWTRFSQWLDRRDWPPLVTGALDRVTDDVLDLLGDPKLEGTWRRRGLVMGDVQSGKTATYTALCCKSADAGYRLVILLTGTLESLRRQTQERLDEGFVGLDSSEMLNQKRTNRIVGVGAVDSRRAAGVFTSRSTDFRQKIVNSLGFRLDAFQEPVLVVVKKHTGILKNLEGWLRSYNADARGKIELPLLLIDDEADHASVNTRGTDDPTAINERIRSLLSLFTRSSYIGFTATPFANIFIDPDTEDEMFGHDLFPRDFVYSLDPPDNYFGPRAIFGTDDTNVQFIKPINDADDYFPIRHRSTLVVGDLPMSLYSAIYSFVIATTIRDLRNEGKTHRSMLINISRFTDVQEQVTIIVDTELRRLQQEIRNFSQLHPDEALKNDRLKALHEVWRCDFQHAGFDWIIVQKALLNGALPIQVKSINQRSGAASLDYKANKDEGLRVIAIGGNSLSRGLTLEGLSTSYFYRNSQMYDTLLQMGRWFGYRDGYGDLCKLWLTDDAAHWYAHITLATEELREELKRMFRLKMAPKDFGLKVRSHPDSLIVTARNKMRTAKTIERTISLSGEGIETSRLRSEMSVIKANAEVTSTFFELLDQENIIEELSPWENRIWKDVPKASIAKLLHEFETHPLNFDFQAREIAKFLVNSKEDHLKLWDVVIPKGKEEEIIFAGGTIKIQRRIVQVKKETRSILVSGRSARVGSRGIEREGIPFELVRKKLDETKGQNLSDSEWRSLRTRPLLLIHLVKPFITPETAMDTGGHPLVALGLSFPYFDDSGIAGRVIYKVNLVEWRSLFDDETDDDQVEVDDEIN